MYPDALKTVRNAGILTVGPERVKPAAEIDKGLLLSQALTAAFGYPSFELYTGLYGLFLLGFRRNVLAR